VDISESSQRNVSCPKSLDEVRISPCCRRHGGYAESEDHNQRGGEAFPCGGIRARAPGTAYSSEPMMTTLMGISRLGADAAPFRRFRLRCSGARRPPSARWSFLLRPSVISP